MSLDMVKQALAKGLQYIDQLRQANDTYNEDKLSLQRQLCTANQQLASSSISNACTALDEYLDDNRATQSSDYSVTECRDIAEQVEQQRCMFAQQRFCDVDNSTADTAHLAALQRNVHKLLQ